MKCTSCKNEILQGSRFCNCCGAAQKTEPKEIKFDFKIKKFTTKGNMPYVLDDDDDLLDEVNKWLATQSLLIMQIIYEPRERSGLMRMLNSISIIYMPIPNNNEIYKISCSVGWLTENCINQKNFDKVLDEFNPWLFYHTMENEYLYKIFVTRIINKTPNLTQEL